MNKFWFLSYLVFLIIACNKPNEKLDNQLNRQNDSVKTNSTPLLKKSVIEQKMITAGLVPVRSLDSSIKEDLKYSTSDNFVGADIYGDFTVAYLQKIPAQKLVLANQLLQKKHPSYCLLIYDAARPRSVQHILWDTLKVPLKDKPKYVADPKIGSIHNYGCAVDLTIYDTKAKEALDMGTKYDFFGKLAYPTKEGYFLSTGQLSQKQVENRRLLRHVMLTAGYQEIETEWWHFVAFSRVETQRKYKIIE